MRVLHITNNYPTINFPVYGIFVKEQIDSLSGAGIHNDVFFINGIEGRKIEYITAVFQLRRFLSKNKYDIIHCHHCFSALTLLISGKARGVKCLLSYQNDPRKEGGITLFKLLYPFFDLLIFKNRSSELRLEKTIYLPNGVDTDFFYPRDKLLCKKQLGLSEAKRYILFMDSNKYKRTQKRVDRFNDTLSILKQTYRLDNIEPLILTNVERHLVPVYVCASDLHLLTSDFEGSPNSVKECLACNVPVVSTPVGNVAYLIGDVDGCYISKYFHSKELAALAFKALDNKSFSSRGSLIEKGLDINAIAQKLIGTYKRLAPEKTT